MLEVLPWAVFSGVVSVYHKMCNRATIIATMVKVRAAQNGIHPTSRTTVVTPVIGYSLGALPDAGRGDAAPSVGLTDDGYEWSCQKYI